MLMPASVWMCAHTGMPGITLSAPLLLACSPLCVASLACAYRRTCSVTLVLHDVHKSLKASMSAVQSPRSAEPGGQQPQVTAERGHAAVLGCARAACSMDPNAVNVCRPTHPRQRLGL